MRTEPFPEETRTEDERSLIHAEQVKQLIANAPVGMAATLINASILVYVLRDVVPLPVLVTWTATLLLLTVVRFIQAQGYRRRPAPPSRASKQEQRFIAGLALSGIVWGAGGIVLYPAGSFVHQVFIAFVLGGMVAGAAGAFSVIRAAFAAFSVPAIVPLILRFLAAGDEIHVTMGAMMLLFATLFFLVALRIHDASVLSLTLRFHNKSLLAYLASEKENAEKLNDELRTEIAERIKAERELQRHRDHLEELVKERTDEWTRANARLQEEAAARGVAEDLRRQSEAYFRSLIENTQDLITVLDSSGNIVFESPSLARMLGYAPEDLIGRNVFEYLHADDHPLAGQILEHVVKTPGESQAIEIRVRHRDGSWRNFESIGKSIIDATGVVHVIVNSRDNTERKRMEADILKVQKLDSLGTLAGGIAHDFNNIITGITANIDLARRLATPGAELASVLEKAEQASRRAHDLTQQLLTFSRGGEPVKKTLMLADLLRDAVGFALRGSKAGYSFDLPSDLKPVEADAGQLRQVVHNIVMNADQAMPGGGMVSVSCENVRIEAGDRRALGPGDYVKVSISDRGVGIPQENLPKIFDPYFTTKEKGSGLGLATAYSIIKKHGGDIIAQSAPAAGTTISVYLPASVKEPAADRPPGGELAAGKGRILIMDDEEIIRDAAGRILQTVGYEVELARDGNEAVEMYQKAFAAGKAFDAVIMDLTVPGGLGGKDAVAKLIEFDPGVKAIVSSGYSHDPIMARYRDFGFRGVIVKPYRVREMCEIVGSVIAMEP